MPRSGTTLLETVIGSHSEIAVPPGDYPFVEQWARGMSVNGIFAALGKKATWVLWGDQDFSDLSEQPHPAAFRDSLLRYAASLGKPIPGAKSPYSEFFFDTYRSWLPDFQLKFVHVVRNPIDVIASLKKSHIHKNWQRFTDLVSVQSENWRRSVLLAAARQVTDGGSYCVVQYENFVAEPEKESRRIAGFLGVEFEQDRMLNRQDYSYYNTNSSFGGNTMDRSPDAAFVYKPDSRKSLLDPNDIAVINRICGEAASAIGYDDHDLRPAPPLYANRLATAERVRRKFARIGRRLPMLSR
jgi:hypothetical protein